MLKLSSSVRKGVGKGRRRVSTGIVKRELTLTREEVCK